MAIHIRLKLDDILKLASCISRRVSAEIQGFSLVSDRSPADG